ncbi:hypothetical protein GE09DRAFT_1230712 [Coniochaeta sp. 2T2.1]|nr:hypothetical protein GE09DRAFT_1230712 [Coniochaeta sp. 2T2.1]
MSQKISGKNLHYDTTLPPFLARLRGQAASSDGPDPLLVRNRRHAAPRSESQEAEDAPLVVDEGGNVVEGLRVGADGEVTETDTPKDKHKKEEGGKEDGEGGREGGEKEKAELKEKEEKTAAIGAGKKRKVGKVVGAADDEGERTGRSSKRGEKKGAEGDGKTAQPVAKKKKAKKIKLSFGDDDG